MTAWTDRPLEQARLFNPAFLLTLLSASAADYEKVRNHGMPWTLGFLVTPLVLAEKTRLALPASTNAHFANWVAAHPEIRLDFGSRAQALTGLTREALRVGLRTGVLRVAGPELYALQKPGNAQLTSDEVGDCIRAARLVGRWFASRHDPTTIFGLLGVMP